MRIFLNRKNFKKGVKGKIKSKKEIYLKHPEKEYDPLIPQIKEYLKNKEYIKTCEIQAQFSLGFPRAYKIMKQLIDLRYVNTETKYKVDLDELNSIF